jgi:hypothetical protein
MRSLLPRLVILACFSGALGAQGAADARSAFAARNKVDFAVPDAPAFKLLEVSQSAILRPQTASELSFALSGFRGANNAFVLPQELGVEISPALIAGGERLTLQRFNAQKWLYRTRLSAATRRDSTGASTLAAGLRFTLVDEQDLRTDENFAADEQVTPYTARILAVYQAAGDRRTREERLAEAPIEPNEAERAQIDSLRAQIKELWKERYWNANSFEFALGVRALTADSLGRDPEVDEVAVWTTYARRLNDWGQVLFGARLSSARDSTGERRQSTALAARLYAGSNAIKLFVEVQQTMREGATASWLTNGGIEVKAGPLGWIDASAGLESAVAGAGARALMALKIKLGLPPI